MRPPADIMSSYLKKEGEPRFDNSFLQSKKVEIPQTIHKAHPTSIDIATNGIQIQKSTKVMEDELKNLQDKISDLETKLSVTTTTAYSKDFKYDQDSQKSEEQNVRVVKKVEIKENQNRTFEQSE